MTSRRNNTSSESYVGKDDHSDQVSSTSEKSNITPAVPASVIYKLLGFTFAMITCPIGIYFLTLNTVFHGRSTWAGATAAIMANVVLVVYVIVAFKDDESEKLAMEDKAKKGE